MVSSGATNALARIMMDLGHRITRQHQAKPGDPSFASMVDFALYGTDGEGKRVLIVVKAPAILDALTESLFQPEKKTIRLDLRPNQTEPEKILNKVNLPRPIINGC